MTEGERQIVEAEVSALEARAKAAEQRAQQAEIERDQLRRLLTRASTSLAERFNDPARAA